MLKPSDAAPLLDGIRQTDFLTADADTLQALGGLLLALTVCRHPQAPQLLSQACAAAVRRFGEATAMAERSRWLQVLLHLHGGDREDLFADVLDDEEFHRLEARQAETERWQQENRLKNRPKS